MSKYEEKMSPKELVEFFSKGYRGSLFILIFDFLLWLASFAFCLAVFIFCYAYFPPDIFTTLTQKEKVFLTYLILSHVLLFSLLFFELFRIIIVDYFKLFEKKIQEKEE